MIASEEQASQIARVSQRISAAILEFIDTHNASFHANDLRVFVCTRVGHTAPGSADRILRNLRQRRVIDYTVISRSQSLYRASVVPQQLPLPLSP